MIDVICVRIYRNRENTISGYEIRDLNGNCKDISAKDLKQAIINKQINVINLKLTKDKRLILKSKKEYNFLDSLSIRELDTEEMWYKKWCNEYRVLQLGRSRLGEIGCDSIGY